MVSSRVFFLFSLVFLALSSLANAATMSPAFEKSLGERLAKRKATLDAHPELPTYVPDSVEMWRILKLATLTERMESLKKSLEISIPYYLKQYPGDAAVVSEFTKDCNDLIAFFEAGVKTGDIVETVPTTRPLYTFAPTTPRPTTAPPTTAPPATKAPKITGTSGSEDEESLDWDTPTPTPRTYKPYTYTPYTYTPYTYTPYTYTPRPSTSRPASSSYEDYASGYYGEESKGISEWKICLIVICIAIFLGRVIYWSKKQCSEEQTKMEEDAAPETPALQAEGGDASHATYVVIRPTEHDN